MIEFFIILLFSFFCGLFTLVIFANQEITRIEDGTVEAIEKIECRLRELEKKIE